MNDTRPIEDQVSLPLAVAVRVVTQGIRIRFGRSVVTILGVVLGIAFLMSTLTSQIIRDGVGEEHALRTEANRMLSFLTAETGLSEGSTYGVIACGPFSAAEERFLRRLVDEGARSFHWASLRPLTPPDGLPAAVIHPTDFKDVGRDVQAVLVMGNGSLPEEVRPATVATTLAFTRHAAMPQHIRGARAVSLDRELKPAEIRRARLDARRRRSRNIWVLAASMVVTVIGVSNAMLMSVTERFREIGTMKCLGALSAFIRRIFLIEAAFMGLVGATVGAVAGALFSVAVYSAAYGLGAVWNALATQRLVPYAAASIAAGVLLSMLAAIYPASVASRMVPSDALRTNV